MKYVSLAFILIAASCQLPFMESERAIECRPIADITKIGSEFEITFKRSLAEVVNGKTNCDFAFMPTKVDNVLIDGHPARFVERDGPPIYSTKVALDLTAPNISFELDGKSYIADSESIEARDGVVRVRMRKFPPK